MDKVAKLKKLKEKVKKLREKRVGYKEAKGVTKPKKHDKKADASKLKGKKKTVIAVGPRGGKYVPTASGKRDYQKSLKTGKIQEFIKTFKGGKMSDVNKSEQKPVDNATQETPAAPAEAPKKQISFDGAFANDFSLGSTLRQDPSGGNVIQNIKAPKMDYVEEAKNKKNISLSIDDIKKK